MRSTSGVSSMAMMAAKMKSRTTPKIVVMMNSASR
jgi:hypothetical protein